MTVRHRQAIVRMILDMHASVHGTAQNSVTDAVEAISTDLNHLAGALGVDLPDPATYGGCPNCGSQTGPIVPKGQLDPVCTDCGEDWPAEEY